MGDESPLYSTNSVEYMDMLSQKARYALRAMLHLAVQPKDEPQPQALFAVGQRLRRVGQRQRL